MWEHTYTKEHLEQTDNAVYSIMRVQNVQQAVDIMIPADPPRNRNEYAQAGEVFATKILMCQPHFADRNAPPQIAYRVEQNVYPPLTLIGHHARAAVLGIALGLYRNGLGYVVSMQETACQFGDDNILTSTAKLGFAISTLVIPAKHEAERLYEAALTCQIPLEKKDEPCVAAHSWEARRLSINLYEILEFFAVMNDGVKAHPMSAVTRTTTHIHLANIAEEVDKATNKKFRMREWVNATVKRLGYDTGVK